MSFNLTSPIPEKGVAVPIYSTFTGYKRLAVWNFALRGLFFPAFILFEEEVELKVKRTHRRFLRDIQSVDVPFWKREQNLLTLIWKDTPWTFTANIVRPDWQKQTLEFLARKNVALSPCARRLLNEPKT